MIAMLLAGKINATFFPKRKVCGFSGGGLLPIIFVSEFRTAYWSHGSGVVMLAT